jgi:hypothetical protein
MAVTGPLSPGFHPVPGALGLECDECQSFFPVWDTSRLPKDHPYQHRAGCSIGDRGQRKKVLPVELL